MTPLIPYRYQCEVSEACWHNIVHNGGSCLVLPTGCGKTLVAALVMDAHLETDDAIVLFVCPTVELVRQQLGALQRYLPHRSVSLISSSIVPDILVGTAGKCLNKLNGWKEGKALNHALLVLDECHHCGSDTSSDYNELLQFQRGRGLSVLGLTATPSPSVAALAQNLGVPVQVPRVFAKELLEQAQPLTLEWKRVESDPDSALATKLRMNLKSLIEEKEVEMCVEELAREVLSVQDTIGVLAAAKLFLRFDDKKRKKTLGTEMHKVFEIVRGIATEVVKQNNTKDGLTAKMREALQLVKEDGQRGILFCGSRASAVAAFQVLRQAGVPTSCVLGGANRRQDARKAVQQFRDGDVRVLTSTTVLEEGIDVPDCSFVVRIDTGYSLAGIVQSRGRVRSREASQRPRFLAIGCSADEQRWQRLLRNDQQVAQELKKESSGADNRRIEPLVERFRKFLQDGGTAGQFLTRSCTKDTTPTLLRKNGLVWKVSIHGLDPAAADDGDLKSGNPEHDETEAIHCGPLNVQDQCLRAAWVLGRPVYTKGAAVSMATTAPVVGIVQRCEPYGASGHVQVHPFQPFISPPVVRHVLSAAPRGALVSIQVDAGEPSPFRDKKPINSSSPSWNSYNNLPVGASFGLLPNMAIGFVEVLRLSGASLKIQKGSGSVDVEHNELSDQEQEEDDDWFDEVYSSQPFLSVSLSDVVAPVVVDDAKVYIPLWNTPKFSVRIKGWDFDTVERTAPPRKLGLGLALVLCLDFRSASALYAKFLPFLRHHGVMFMFGHLTSPLQTPEAAERDSHERLACTVRQLCSFKLCPDWRIERPHLSSVSASSTLDTAFCGYLSLFGSFPFVAALSPVLDSRVWFALASVSTNFSEVLAAVQDLLTSFCFVSLAAVLQTIREVAEQKPLLGACTTGSWKLTVTPTAVRCSWGPALPASRGVLLWQQRCSERKQQTSLLHLVLCDEDGQRPDMLGEELLKDMVNPVFASCLELPATGDAPGTVVRLSVLHWSMSMLKRSAMILVSECNEQTVDDFLAIDLLQGKLQDTPVYKRASRLALWFTATKGELEGGPKQWRQVQDIVHDGFDFTDGGGAIDHEELKNTLPAALRDGETLPCAIQVRMGGCKGVLQIMPKLTERESVVALLPKSMVKVPIGMTGDMGNARVLVCETARRLPLYLNHQVILLLVARGVSNETFIRLLEKELVELLRSFQNPEDTFNRLSLLLSSFLSPTQLRGMQKKGIDPLTHVFFRELLAHCLRVDVARLRRGRIRVRKGALLMGVPDLKGFLRAGQVFVQVSASPHGEGEGVIQGQLTVTKNPCLHPGDVRVLTAVRCPPLEDLRDVIVFPTGTDLKRPHPDQISGSDLDGDLYWVSWDPELLPRAPASHLPAATLEDELGNVQAMDYTARQEQEEPPPSRASYFLRVIAGSALGQVSNCHKFYADRDRHGAFSDRCLQLAQMCSDAVDAPKTGTRVEIPRECRIPWGRKPEWMLEGDERQEAEKSDTLLQKLADALNETEEKLKDIDAGVVYVAGERVLPIPAPIQRIKEILANKTPERWQHLHRRAVAYRESYHRALRQLMRRFGAWSEAEALSGELLLHRGTSRHTTREHALDLQAGVRSLKLQMYGIWKAEVESKEAQAAAEIAGEGVTSAHVVAIVWFMVAHSAPKKIVTKINAETKVRLFVSFGWIAVEALTEVLSQCQEAISVAIGYKVCLDVSDEEAALLTAGFKLKVPDGVNWCLRASLFFQNLYDHHRPPIKSSDAATDRLWPESHPAAHLVVSIAQLQVIANDAARTKRSSQVVPEKKCTLAPSVSSSSQSVWASLLSPTAADDDTSDSTAVVTKCLVASVAAAVDNADPIMRKAAVSAAAALALSPKQVLTLQMNLSEPRTVQLGRWFCSEFKVRDAQAYCRRILGSAHAVVELRCKPASTRAGGLDVKMWTKHVRERDLNALHKAAQEALSQGSREEKTFFSSYNQTSCNLSPETQQQVVDCVNKNDVIIVIGPTGSGKSSLLPQVILDQMHPGCLTRVLVTEPRRVAAVALAHTVANMRGWTVGKQVGYTIGGDHHCGLLKDTRLEYGTNSIVSQRLVWAGDNPLPFTHIILDEIHIRSRYDDINMAVMLKMIENLKRAPKLILMSATADVTQLQKYLQRPGVSVGRVDLPSGRFTVQKRYLEKSLFKEVQHEWSQHNQRFPLPERLDDLKELCKWLAGQNIEGAQDLFGFKPRYSHWLAYVVACLLLFIHREDPSLGRMLCFLPGEPEIRGVMEWLHFFSVDYEDKPFSYRMIMGKQTVEAQRECLNEARTDSGTAGRVILLASDVIESCVTPADVQIVVDCLLQKRMSGDNHLRTQRVSHAEADQRSGRAGRQDNGVVYRLASKSFFISQKFIHYPRPEIETVGLEDLLLQLCVARGTGTDAKEAAFTAERAVLLLSDLMNPPNLSKIKSAIQCLLEVGALRQDQKTKSLTITTLGRLLQALPVDPRCGLLLLNGLRFGCLDDCAALVAVLRIRRSIFHTSGSYRWDEKTYRDAAKARQAWSNTSDLLAGERALRAYRYAVQVAEGDTNSVIDMCERAYLSHDALLEASGNLDELLSSLRRQGWLVPESCSTAMVSIPRAAPRRLSNLLDMAPVRSSENIQLLSFVLVASFPHLVVERDHQKIPRKRKDWPQQLKCRLPSTNRRRRGRTLANPREQESRLQIFFVGSSVKIRAGLALVSFSSVETCLSAWREVRTMPPALCPWRPELNAEYSYQLLNPQHNQSVFVGLSSTFSAPVPERLGTTTPILLATNSLKLEGKSRNNMLLTDLTQLPGCWGGDNWKTLLYAAAPGVKDGAGNMCVMLNGEQFLLPQPSGAAACSACRLRELLDEEESGVPQFAGFAPTQHSIVAMIERVQERARLVKEISAQMVQTSEQPLGM
eukprot:gb/GEZN01000055.1/.p1 GENE.gb/GEZN01000055.1/~~gb/GEZN01000055.1/.p1  ORF type:complete len:2902 (-),score=336.26 gb/GEZN01000055.1/:27-8732(-)